MHQKIGLCGLYVVVSYTPDKGGSSVLMVGDEVLQRVVYLQRYWRKCTDYVTQVWQHHSFPVPP